MNKQYCVYMHKFPNRKKYIGISSDAEKRWRNGKGYETQGKIAHAIEHYGWGNVEHTIVVDGITKEQAETLEKFLIAELDTINNGYNTTIGGEKINGTYLDKYVLEMIRGAKAQFGENQREFIDVSEWASKARYDKEWSELCNSAARSIVYKHGNYKSTNFEDVFTFWFYFWQYIDLNTRIIKGEDVSNWSERVSLLDRHYLGT